MRVNDPKLKLFHHLQNTKRVGHTLIQGCQYVPNHIKYDAVRKLLNEYFGQKMQVATACTDVVVNGSILNKNDTAALLEFSLKFISCLYTFSFISYLNKMDHFDVIRTLTKHFPYQWLPSWEHTIDQFFHFHQREIGIADVCNFVYCKNS